MTDPRFRSLPVFLAALLGVAFPLHLAWEYLQCQPFFVHGAVPATSAAMLRATLGDLVLTALAYLGVVAVVRDWHWPLRRWTAWVWIALLTLALALSIAVEWHGLGMGLWSYSGHAPLLPWTRFSALPVLQLLILFPLSFGSAARIARRVVVARD